MYSCEELDKELQKKLKKAEFEDLVKKLQVLSYNNRADNDVLCIVEEAIKRSESLDDEISLIKLYSLKITHIQHLKKRFYEISKLAENILELSTKNNFTDGIALYYAHKWYIEKFEGNKKKANSAIKHAWEIVSKSESHDEFIYSICSYLYAIEIWVEYRSFESATILEKCVDFFTQRTTFMG